MAKHPLAEEFFKEVVQPTVDEYLAQPGDIRRGRLAAIVLNHMVDYWHEDTGKSLTSIRKTLSDATRFRTYSFFQTVMDVADVSKHARLELDRRTPAPELTKTNQVVHHRIGALGTFPMATLPMGGTAIVGVNVKLDNGSVFSLSHAIQQVMTIWDKMLESSRNTPLL